MKRCLATAALALLGATATFGYTNVLDNGLFQTVTNDWDAGDLVVGATTSSNLLNIVDGGNVASASGLIGNTPAAQYNVVYLDGTNAVWNNSGSLLVGNAGSQNILYIGNGARVSADTAEIGRQFSASNNSVYVSGKGSLLSVTNDLYVGRDGSDNLLSVQSGGTLSNANGYVGFANDASNNAVVVTGVGSQWINDGVLHVGSAVAGTNNLVVVSGGGRAEADSLDIHDGNQLQINDGGTLTINGGFDVAAQGNVAWNAGGGLAVSGTLTGMETTNFGGSSYVYLDNGRDLTIDGGSWDNGTTNLVVGLGGSGSKLTIQNGASVSNSVGYIGWGSNAGGNSVVVSGGSVWNNSSNLYVGVYHDASNQLVNAGSGNALTVSNGAWLLVGEVGTNGLGVTGGLVVASTNGASLDVGGDVSVEQQLYVGTGVGTNGNVTVRDGGSVAVGGLVINDGNFNLESGGALSVSGAFDASKTGFHWNDGASLSIGGDLSGLSGLGGTNRTLAITGSGGKWELGTNDLMVGGSGDSLVISNGGTVSDATGYIGQLAGENGNSVLVSGSNSVWNNSGDLYVGQAGQSNTLTITDGGTVSNVNGYVGFAASASNNTVAVSGNGSLWYNDGKLEVGSAATNAGNRVSVSDGGRIEFDSLSIHDGNRLDIDAGGTLAALGDFNLASQSNLHWNSYGTLSVGGDLTGMATNSIPGIGGAVYLNGDGRGLVIDGGSWTNGDNSLVVGYNGTVDGNRLVVTNGGTVQSAGGYIGWGYGSGNNSVVVTGSNSTWAVKDGDLYVGVWKDGDGNEQDAAAGNSLVATNGAWVLVGEGATTNHAAEGGIALASTNGAKLVVGNSATVDAGAGLYLGVDTNLTGTATVRSGALISADRLEIAAGSAFNLAADGTLAIRGDLNAGMGGFHWNDYGTLSVGGNLTGVATTNLGTTATYIDGVNKTLVIDGGTWTNGANDLIVGLSGTTNLLYIVNGGTVSGNDGYIGYASNAVGNAVWVDGTNSALKLAGDLHLQSGNGLFLSSSGRVTVVKDMFIQSNTVVKGVGTVAFSDADNTLHLSGPDIALDNTVLFDGMGGSDRIAVADGTFSLSGLLTNRFVNFETLDMTNSVLAGAGALDGISDLKMDGGAIKPTGTIEIDAQLDASGTVYNPTISGSSVGQLHFTGPSPDLSGMTAQVDLRGAPSNGVATVLSADNGIAQPFADVTIKDYLLLYDAVLQYVGNSNLNVVVTPSTSLGSTPSYAIVQGVRAGFNALENAVFTRTRQLRRNVVATDSAVPSSARTAPVGPYGPGDRNTIFDMHFWMQQYSGQGSYDALGSSSPGFSLNHYGSTFGFDRLFGEDLVGGFNYTYERADATAADATAVNTETYWLALYGDWLGKDGWFVDALASAGFSQFTSQRREGDYLGQGNCRGTQWGAHVDVGRYFKSGNWAFTPYGGLHGLSVNHDAYTEANDDANENLRVGGLSVASLETVAGLRLRNRFDTRIGRFQTVGYGEWAYDCLNQDSYDTLSDGTISVRTAGVAPEPVTANVGVGFSWIATDYMEVGVGYDGRFNADYSENMGSLMLHVMF